MPIAETVACLARCIARERAPLSMWEESLVSVLVQLPNFRDQHEIPQWEALFDDAWESGAKDAENPSGYFATSRLLLQVFELGRTNLYAAFSEGRTLGEYQSLVRELSVHHGISVPDELDVSDW